MRIYFPINKICKILIFIFLITSCGSDVVEDIIETYDSGRKKVYVRYHSEPNVLEKHFYNDAGEMVYLERDSLSYGDYFKQFMYGTWIVDKMTVNDEIIFEKDSVLNLDNLPNIYYFTSKELLVRGSQFNAEYKIQYLDSSRIAFEGKWEYGREGESTYRTERIYDIDFFQILSYYTIIWSGFIEDEEKEEEVIFRRIENFNQDVQLDSNIIITDTTLSTNNLR